LKIASLIGYHFDDEILKKHAKHDRITYNAFLLHYK